MEVNWFHNGQEIFVKKEVDKDTECRSLTHFSKKFNSGVKKMLQKRFIVPLEQRLISSTVE